MQLNISFYEETLAIQICNLQNSLIGKCFEGKPVWILKIELSRNIFWFFGTIANLEMI